MIFLLKQNFVLKQLYEIGPWFESRWGQSELFFTWVSPDIFLYGFPPTSSSEMSILVCPIFGSLLVVVQWLIFWETFAFKTEFEMKSNEIKIKERLIAIISNNDHPQHQTWWECRLEPKTKQKRNVKGLEREILKTGCSTRHSVYKVYGEISSTGTTERTKRWGVQIQTVDL